MTRPLAGVLAAAIALSGLTVAAYGHRAGTGLGEILLPLGAATIATAGVTASGRVRSGGLRRQLAVLVAIALLQTAVAVALFVHAMLVSAHDALFTLLLVACAALAVAAGLDAAVARLDAEERSRRRRIAAVAHDLRTPITALRLMTDAIGDDLVAASVRDEYLARMAVHVRALSSLVTDLFELSRIEAGDLAWSPEDVRLDQLVDDAVEAMRPRAEAEAIRLHLELPPAPTFARADPDRIRRVLFNLIDNAIRHTPRKGAIVVRLEPSPRGFELEVADTGDGIGAQDHDRVFEPFAVGAGREAGADGSAGLGLAIARAIVEGHGGRIWLEQADVGARVRFSLPSAAMAVGPERPGPAARAAGPGSGGISRAR
jgi:signal transduction histidine kinase